MTPTQLAIKITKYILERPSVTYDELEARATLKQIDPQLFQEAMGVIHKYDRVSRSTRGDTIVYGPKREKPVNEWHERWATWQKENYPPMVAGINDGKHDIFSDLDLSWMFMAPDDAEVYWDKKRYRPWELSRK